MSPFIWLIDTLINLALVVIVVQAILSWLIAFDIASPHNRAVGAIWTATNRLTEPLYAPVRRFVPNLGGIDITPMIVIVGLLFLQQVVYAYFA